jgi:predicted CXXCH cytochrome family protein
MEIQVTFVSVDQRGQTQREQRRITGPVLTVGRGTQCQIHLPDPRVPLSSARITVTDDGTIIEADPGRIQINGHAAQNVKLAVGDKIEIGPYLLQVETAPEGIPLALSVTLVNPIPIDKGVGLARVALKDAGVSKRRLSYIAFAGVLLLTLLVPIASDLLSRFNALSPGRFEKGALSEITQGVSAKFTQAWNPGPLAQSHQPFASNCRACHKIPFKQVRDRECITCHKRIKEHVPSDKLTGLKGEAFREIRCAECHLDHKGSQMAPRAQEQCAACHADIKKVAKDALSEKATDFRTEHPQFRLSLLDADNPKLIRLVRQGKQNARQMVEHSNLKFNHKLHLNPEGVRDPEGKRDPRGMFDAQGRRTILKCANCHEPEDGGRLMQPISMKRHCQKCHSLAFERQVTERQVQHGSEAAVSTMLREFYARLVLGDVPPDVDPPPDLHRRRPGEILTYQDRQASLRIANQKTSTVLYDLFYKRKVCSTCHYVKRAADEAGWGVAPVRLARVWMPQAMFTHAKHATQKCVSCHDVTNSKEAKDIAMPNIGKCRECHAGAKPVSGKITSDCATCHKFHGGRDFWHKEMQSQMLLEGSK